MTSSFYKSVLLLLLLSLVPGCNNKREGEQIRNARKIVEATDKLPAAQRQKILDSIYSTLENGSNDSMSRVIIRDMAWRYYGDGHYDKYEKVSRRLYNMAEEKNDTAMIAFGQYYLGDCYSIKGKSDSSLYYYIQAEKMFTAVKDTLNTGRAIQCTATVLYYNGNYAETEIQAIRALTLFKETNEGEPIYSSYMALAVTLADMGNYDKALEYYNLALDQVNRMEHEKLDDERRIWYLRGATYVDMGDLYTLKNEYGTAISFYNKGLEIKNIKTTYPYMYALLISNRANAEVMLNNLGTKVKTDLFEARHIHDSLQITTGITDNQVHIGNYYLASHDTTTALVYIKEALKNAKSIKSSRTVTNTLSILAIADRKNTTAWSQEYFRVTDSLQQAERATRNKFARIEYETERIEQQNKVLNKRFNMIVTAGIVLLIFTTGLFIIIRLRAKNRELRHAREQQMANEKIYTLLMQQEAEAENAKVNERNRLAMELHDGILNRIFTTRFNLSQLKTDDEPKKELLVQELQDTQDEIRKLSHDLKESFMSENESFTSALKDMVEKQQEANGPVFDLYIDKFINWAHVTPETRVAMFRIIQEASTNARKHAQAANCNIALMAQGQTIKLRIWDDGKGFEAKKEKQGIGLKNIADRIKALGGSFTLNSAPGEGTVIEILV